MIVERARSLTARALACSWFLLGGHAFAQGSITIDGTCGGSLISSTGCCLWRSINGDSEHWARYCADFEAVDLSGTEFEAAKDAGRCCGFPREMWDCKSLDTGRESSSWRCIRKRRDPKNEEKRKKALAAAFKGPEKNPADDVPPRRKQLQDLFTPSEPPKSAPPSVPGGPQEAAPPKSRSPSPTMTASNPVAVERPPSEPKRPKIHRDVWMEGSGIETATAEEYACTFARFSCMNDLYAKCHALGGFFPSEAFKYNKQWIGGQAPKVKCSGTCSGTCRVTER